MASQCCTGIEMKRALNRQDGGNARVVPILFRVCDLKGAPFAGLQWLPTGSKPVKNWSDRRVTLLGDAAHPMLQYLAQGAGQAIEDAVVLGEALRFTRGDVEQAFQKYQQARYLRTGRVQLTARFYGDIYHAAGVQRELRNQLFQSGKESAGFAGLKWMYDGIDLKNLFH